MAAFGGKIVAEISATRRIFQAVKVRVAVVVTLLATPILYLVKTFAGAAISDAANKVIELLTPIFGGYSNCLLFAAFPFPNSLCRNSRSGRP
jgi:hypothetical protein